MDIRDPFQKNKVFLIVCFTIAIWCCNNQSSEQISVEAENYIDEVLSVLAQHSYKKNEINWQAFRDNVIKVAENASTIEDVYPAVTYAISAIEDHHSYFVSFEELNNHTEELPPPKLKDEIVPDHIGYIRIPYCIGNEGETVAYISNVTEKISVQNKSQITGWIIDLRDNFGGNMWPMLVVAGPFLPVGSQGYFIQADQEKNAWQYTKGEAMLDTISMAINPNPILLIQNEIKLAILTNAKTASSGEAIAVVFKGLPNVKSFGEKTYGVSTGCKAFTLSDGSRINLATSVFADRNLKKYGSSIVPDVKCESEIALQKAIEWINNDSEN